MKMYRFVATILLVVTCVVLLCGCSFDVASEDFDWIKTSGRLVKSLGTSGVLNGNCYPLELLTDASYKVEVCGNVFYDATDNCVKTDKDVVYIHYHSNSQTPVDQGDWGEVYRDNIVLYFLDDNQQVVGYAIVEMWLVFLEVEYPLSDGKMEPSSWGETNYYAKITHSKKFIEKPLSFEQAQKVTKGLVK